MSFTLIAHRSDVLASSAGPSTAIDSTGADLLIVTIEGDRNAMLVNLTVPTDSKSNPWNALTLRGNVGDGGVQIFWSKPTAVGSGHTITTVANLFQVIHFEAWSGSHASPYVTGSENGANGTAITSLATGSTTNPGDLVVTALVYDLTSGVPTIDSSFTTRDNQFLAGGVNYGGILADKLSGSAENPTWSFASTVAATAIAAFAAAAGGGGVAPAAELDYTKFPKWLLRR